MALLQFVLFIILALNISAMFSGFMLARRMGMYLMNQVMALMLAMMVSTYGQKPTIELTFTAIDSAAYLQLDSIKVMNRTQGSDTVLY